MHHAVMQEQKSYNLPLLSKCSFSSWSLYNGILSALSGTLCHQSFQESSHAHVERGFWWRRWRWQPFSSPLPSSSLHFMQQSLLLYTWFRVHEHWTWSSHPSICPSQPQLHIWSSWGCVLHCHSALWALSSSSASIDIHYFYQWTLASSEEAFIICITKLATGRTNTSLMEVFGVIMNAFISRYISTP
jgi:hypothetical protein